MFVLVILFSKCLWNLLNKIDEQNQKGRGEVSGSRFVSFWERQKEERERERRERERERKRERKRKRQREIDQLERERGV